MPRTNMPLRRSPRIAAQQKPSATAKAQVRGSSTADIKIPRRSPRIAARGLVKGSKEYFVIIIRYYLELIYGVRCSDTRIATSTSLMNFIHTEAISFVKEHPRFHSCIINKCYDLKRAVHLLGKESPAFMEACNKVLVALGQPLEQTLRPETMTKHELSVLIQQLKNYRERAACDI